jgi:hypothetical protein
VNYWPFVIAAYSVALGATGLLLLLSWQSMRRAETAAEDLSRR